MGISKRGNTWYIDYTNNGRRIREAIGSSKREAQDVLAKRRVLIRENRHFVVHRESNVTFGQLAKEYLEFSRVNKRSYVTDKYRMRALERHIKAEIRLKEITNQLIEGYKAKRCEEDSCRGDKMRPASINREVALLQHMLTKAVEWGYIEDNPGRGIKRLKECNERDRVLTREEFDRLLVASPPYARFLLLAAYYTTMRRGELFALTWDQVDLAQGFIRLHSSDTKTSEPRTIPLASELVEALHELQRVRYIGVDHVFTRNGKPMKGLRKWFSKARRDAGIEDFRFHDLRHTCITNMRRAGIDIITIMKISGHKTMDVFRRYNTVDENDLREAAKRLDQTCHKPVTRPLGDVGGISGNN